MTWPEIDDDIFQALGGTIVGFELKGNLATAERLASQAVQSAHHSEPRERGSAAELQYAIVRLIQGDAAAAVRHTVAAEKFCEGEPHAELRALAWRRAAEHANYHVFPGDVSSNSIHLGNGWRDANDREDQYAQHWAAVFPRCRLAYAINEAVYVYGVIGTRSVERDLAVKLRGGAKQQHLKAVLEKAKTFANDDFLFRFRPFLFAALNVHVGEVLFLAREYASALEWLAQARNIYRHLGDVVGEAWTWLVQGDWFFQPAGPSATLGAIVQEQYTEESVAPAPNEGHTPAAAPDTESARRAWAEAESRLAQVAAPRALAAIRLRQGWLADQYGDSERATFLCAEAEREFAAAGDSYGRWTAAAHRMLLQIASRDMKEDHDSALILGRWGIEDGSFSLALGFGVWFGQLGASLTNSGNYERALACHRLAKTIFGSMGARFNEAQSLCDQAVISERAGDRAGTAVFLEEALTILDEERSISSSRSAAINTRIVGMTGKLFNIYVQTMDSDGMRQLSKRMARVAEMNSSCLRKEDLLSATEIYSLISESLKQGRLPTPEEQQAIDAVQQAELTWQLLSTAEKAKVLATYYEALRHRRHGRNTLALASFEEALRETEGAIPEERPFLRATVLTYSDDKRDEARTAFLEYLAQDRKYGEIVRAAGFDAEQGELNARAIERLSATYKHEEAALFLLRLGFAEEARTHIRALEEISNRKDWWISKETPWEAQGLSAEIEERNGDFEAALMNYKQAVTALENSYDLLQTDTLRIGLRGTSAAGDLCLNAARANLTCKQRTEDADDYESAQKYAASAFEYAQKGRARALLDLLAENRRASGEDHARLIERRQLEAALATARASLARMHRIGSEGSAVQEIRTRIVNLEKELRTRGPALMVRPEASARLATRDPATLESIAAQLQSDAVLLEYTVLDREVLMWAITRDGMASSRRIKIREFELHRRVLALRNGCSEGEYLTEAHFLSDLLLGPFADILQSHSRILMVRHACLHLIPFSVLPLEGSPLGLTHSITFLPAAAVLLHPIRDRVLQERSVLAVGNPAAMSAQLDDGWFAPAPLPAAADEARFVASQFPRATLLSEGDATHKNVREAIRHASVLHFATHGVVHAVPYRSAILLANGQCLSMEDCMSLELDVDLAVISTCNSGHGEITRGDEVLGLARGFLAAGIRCVIVSQWAVHDRVTGLLMKQFYREYTTGREPAEALAHAQAWLSELDEGDPDAQSILATIKVKGMKCLHKPFAHPRYWSAFVLHEAGHRVRASDGR